MIPKVFTDYYLKMGRTSIPSPRIKESRKHRNVVEHILVYDDPMLPEWVPSGKGLFN